MKVTGKKFADDVITIALLIGGFIVGAYLAHFIYYLIWK
jgi:hypothetical protein